MKKTTDYLDAARKKLDPEMSWYKFAIESGITRTALTRYNKGNRVMDVYACMVVAEILEIDPIEIITLAEKEREKDQDKKAFWVEKLEKYGQAAAVTLCAVILSFSFSFQEVNADSANNETRKNFYYVKYHK